MNLANTERFEDCAALPQVALSFMNQVHCEELELVANLLSHLQERAPMEEINSLLIEWVAHTKAHFEREERLMEEYRFPPYPIHKMAHQQALESLIPLQQQWLESGNYIALERHIKQEWRAWLQQHISTMDTATANFLSQFDIQVEL